MLLSNQKTFVQRLDSPLDDRKAWLNSIAQAVTGKTLEAFTDQDEILLYEKFKAMILELDSYIIRAENTYSNMRKQEIYEDIYL